MRQHEDDAPPAAALLEGLRTVRGLTEALARPLSAEDQQAQSMPDASPTKWHLAHTTWFFERLVLVDHAGATPFDARFDVLFNSYYEALGPRHPRPRRGLLTRPSLDVVLRWRAHVDAALGDLLARDALPPRARALVELGLHHEQQHQELLLTDAKHLLAQSPLAPAYAPARRDPPADPPPLAWHAHPGGAVEVGAPARGGFSFDNERPRHAVLLRPFRLASRPVTNAEFLAFVDDGGYARPGLWLSDGWAVVQERGWEAPLHWRRHGGGWQEFTLAGLEPLQLAAPVTHVSYYEADAYARWAGRRLPLEAEWEVFAARAPRDEAGLLDPDRLHPRPCPAGAQGPAQLLGDVWEWTASAYAPYPGFRPAEGAVAEYNGKFMVSQLVLRGGSCATPRGHARATYRNFFPPDARWQFSGVRLAEDAA
ncbi:MAG: ergothioneine biosynthesis protein EgtB [Planctomycetes bacterium]|nr:ergothioneine biosynthesis protein EgtB [Planctomycetota bacterium]